MYLEGSEKPSRGHVPEPVDVIVAHGSGCGAVGRKAEAADITGVGVDLEQLLAGSRIPEPDGAVGRAAQDARAVGRIGEDMHQGGMATELKYFLFAIQVIDDAGKAAEAACLPSRLTATA